MYVRKTARAIRLIAAALLWSACQAAQAQGTALTTELVQQALNAAVAKAREIRVPMGIAVVDTGGNLVGFIKMDGALLHTDHTSYSKAYTAVSVRRPTHQTEIPPDITLAITLATEGRFTSLPGGLPLVKNGRVIGGIGAAGGNAKEDVTVAQAGAAAVRE